MSALCILTSRHAHDGSAIEWIVSPTCCLGRPHVGELTKLALLELEGEAEAAAGEIAAVAAMHESVSQRKRREER